MFNVIARWGALCWIS